MGLLFLDSVPYGYQPNWAAIGFWLLVFSSFIIIFIVIGLVHFYFTYFRYLKRKDPDADFEGSGPVISHAAVRSGVINSIEGDWKSLFPVSIVVTFDPDGTFEMLYKTDHFRHSIMDGSMLFLNGEYREWGTYKNLSKVDTPSSEIIRKEEYALHFEAGGYTDKKEKASPKNIDTNATYLESREGASFTIKMKGDRSIAFFRYEKKFIFDVFT